MQTSLINASSVPTTKRSLPKTTKHLLTKTNTREDEHRDVCVPRSNMIVNRNSQETKKCAKAYESDDSVSSISSLTDSSNWWIEYVYFK